MHKIGCGSAIKVNFIALALHYLCNEQLKPFGKMKTIFVILFIFSLFIGLYGYAFGFLVILIIIFFNKGGGASTTRYDRHRYNSE